MSLRCGVVSFNQHSDSVLQNFKRLATGLNIEPLLASITRQPDLWNEITARQEYPGTAHKYSESIFLRWPVDLTIDAAFNHITAVDYPAMDKLLEARELISGLVREVGGTSLGRVQIVKLAAGKLIDAHADEGAAADHYERFHIPLMSQPNNEFFSQVEQDQNEMVWMKPGELWWFNHKKKHWLYNMSPAPRVHLIADIVSPKYRVERE